MIDEKVLIEHIKHHKETVYPSHALAAAIYELAHDHFIDMVNIQPKVGGWIPCSERLPVTEVKVLIHAKRKYKDGSFKDIITTAMYEDGTVLEDESIWFWEDVEGEWDEEAECYIIPEGWWEDKAYNADGELNHAVDDEVIAWMPLPEPYDANAEAEKPQWQQQMMDRFLKGE